MKFTIGKVAFDQMENCTSGTCGFEDMKATAREALELGMGEDTSDMAAGAVLEDGMACTLTDEIEACTATPKECKAKMEDSLSKFRGKKPSKLDSSKYLEKAAACRMFGMEAGEDAKDRIRDMLSMTTDNVDEKKVDRAYSKALKSKATSKMNADCPKRDRDCVMNAPEMRDLAEEKYKNRATVRDTDIAMAKRSSELDEFRQMMESCTSGTFKQNDAKDWSNSTMQNPSFKVSLTVCQEAALSGDLEGTFAGVSGFENKTGKPVKKGYLKGLLLETTEEAIADFAELCSEGGCTIDDLVESTEAALGMKVSHARMAKMVKRSGKKIIADHMDRCFGAQEFKQCISEAWSLQALESLQNVTGGLLEAPTLVDMEDAALKLIATRVRACNYAAGIEYGETDFESDTEKKQGADKCSKEIQEDLKLLSTAIGQDLRPEKVRADFFCDVADCGEDEECLNAAEVASVELGDEFWSVRGTQALAAKHCVTEHVVDCVKGNLGPGGDPSLNISACLDSAKAIYETLEPSGKFSEVEDKLFFDSEAKLNKTRMQINVKPSVHLEMSYDIDNADIDTTAEDGFDVCAAMGHDPEQAQEKLAACMPAYLTPKGEARSWSPRGSTKCMHKSTFTVTGNTDVDHHDLLDKLEECIAGNTRRADHNSNISAYVGSDMDECPVTGCYGACTGLEDDVTAAMANNNLIMGLPPACQTCLATENNSGCGLSVDWIQKHNGGSSGDCSYKAFFDSCEASGKCVSIKTQVTAGLCQVCEDRKAALQQQIDALRHQLSNATTGD